MLTPEIDAKLVRLWSEFYEYMYRYELGEKVWLGRVSQSLATFVQCVMRVFLVNVVYC